MTPTFSVQATPHYDRLARRLLRQHPDFDGYEDRAREILRADPYNRTRGHNIKKLEGVSSDDGQYRLTLGRWRFRYDIHGQDVVLKRCSLRREDTYR